ncbi:MAG TPA: MEDS domain-containing protein [Candidatus Acidoferrum sp.]|nr:MEDS domain-containing protein [Candidatus Acidoferrum sp.]
MSFSGHKLADTPEAKFTRCHEVQFYPDDAVFLERITHFIGTALKFGNAAIVIATRPHRDMLLERLKTEGVDVDVLIQQGTYVSLDAAHALSTFMINEWPDSRRFLDGFNSLIESALKAAKAKHPRVAILRESVALLWRRVKGKPRFGSNNSAKRTCKEPQG